jgi:hypothetical protein
MFRWAGFAVGQNTVGKTTGPKCQALGAKIFRFTEVRKWRIDAASRPNERGVSRSSQYAGRNAVDAGSIGAITQSQGGKP